MLQLILAAILALPALVVSAIASIVVGVLSLPAMWLLKFKKSSKNETTSKKSHAIITGGSSGIGLAVAKECVARGMNRVTILARNQEKLDVSRQELEAMDTTTQIQALSVDVTNADALALIAPRIIGDSSEDEGTYLFCCAGFAQPGAFADLPASTFAEQINTNYLGSVYTVHAFLPLMARGTIVLTSSAAGQIGVFGYTAYTPTKFALRGFAESLHMELLSRPNVHVQLVFPPDTDTPGFTEENKHKPHETNLISETMGLMKPQEVGRRIVMEATCAMNPRFAVYFGFDGWMLSTVTSGMSPETSFLDGVAQVSVMSLLRMISFFVLNDFWRNIRNYHQDQYSDKGHGDIYGTMNASKTDHTAGAENATT
jgi:3-dehydrosphinganine reductase